MLGKGDADLGKASICDPPDGSGSSGNRMVMFHTAYPILTERDRSRSESLNSGHSGGDSSCPASHQNHELESNACFLYEKTNYGVFFILGKPHP